MKTYKTRSARERAKAAIRGYYNTLGFQTQFINTEAEGLFNLTTILY